MYPLIIILRGVPGSGKSTFIQLVRNKYPDLNIQSVSADDYWIQDDGTYKFNSNKLWLAHKSCQTKFVRLIDAKTPPTFIFVDNTNITEKDCNFYVSEAIKRNLRIDFLHIKFNKLEDCFTRNIHGVPQETILKMNNNYKPIFNEVTVTRENWEEVVDALINS